MPRPAIAATRNGQATFTVRGNSVGSGTLIASSEIGSTVATFVMLVGVYVVLLIGLARMNPALLEFMVATIPGQILVTVMLTIFLSSAYYMKAMSLGGDD